jgi:hypothetical protein
MSTSLTISIKSLGHDTVSVTIPRTYSVLELKSKLQSLFYIDRKRQRLLFQGKILKDERKLLDYGKDIRSILLLFINYD